MILVHGNKYVLYLYVVDGCTICPKRMLLYRKGDENQIERILILPIIMRNIPGIRQSNCML